MHPSHLFSGTANDIFLKLSTNVETLKKILKIKIWHPKSSDFFADVNMF